MYKWFLVILGQNWNFNEKVVKNALSEKLKKRQISKISKFDLRPKSAGNRPICGRKVGLDPKSSPKFFYPKRTKIHDFISKKHTPP